MNYLAVGLVLVIIFILYTMFTYLTNTALVAGLQPLGTQLSWTFDKIANPTSISYCYHCWLYISKTPGGDVPIFSRGDTATTGTEFSVSLDGNLNLSVNLQDSTGSIKKVMTVMSNFPLQKWVYLTVNVQNTIVEAYINGKLAKTVTAASVKTPGLTKTIFVGNTGLSGYITKFYRQPTALSSVTTLDALTVQNNYLAGNGLNNWFETAFPYGMNLTVTNTNSANRVIKVF